MTSKTRLFLALFFCLPALEALLSIIWLASTPSDRQTALFFGLSQSRLAIAGFLFLAASGYIFLATLAWQKPLQTADWLKEKLGKPQFLIATALNSGLIFLAAGCFLAIPHEYLGKLWAIEERLRPFTLWALLVSFQILAGIIGWQSRQKSKPRVSNRENIFPIAITLGAFLFIWIFISLTKLGFSGGNSFWSKAGVPLLWPQIFLALGFGLALHYLLARFVGKANLIWLDLGLGLIFWLAAVILWNGQSYSPGVFNTQARPPTDEIFPINDSYVFDLAAQKMLIGRELAAEAQDKPIFIAHLVILHLLAGENFSYFYLLQIFSFACIPICGYLLGKNLHSRSLGMFFAILLILKEQNAIKLTNYIHVSTSKLILSEMLTTLGLLLFTLALIRWLKSPHLTNPALWLAGGILGLTSLSRLNAISILPAAILLIGLALKFKLKQWGPAALVFAVFLLVSTAPWLARNVAASGDPFNFIRGKTAGVIVNERYNPIIAPSEKIDPLQAQPTASKPGSYLTLAEGMATNYLHNLIGVTVMLPPSLKLYRLLDLVRLPYWKMEWDGSLLPGAFWIILAVLTLTAQGVASAWKRWRAAGLAPLTVILGYNLTTALSLTSGGRYLVPFDWVVLFYFSLGLFEAALWVLTLFGWPKNTDVPQPLTNSSPKGKLANKPWLQVSLTFLLLGSLPVLLENLPPERYPKTVSLSEFISANQSLPALSSPEMTKNVRSLANDPLAKTLYGRALYPRYYGENKGDAFTIDQDPLIGSATFDHLAFLLLDSASETPIILPFSGKISSSISGADVWVLGCQRESYVEAVLVVFRAKETLKVYQPELFKTTCQP